MNITKTKRIIIAIVSVLVSAALTITVLITTGIAVETKNNLFNNGLVPVCDENGKWGYINVNGITAINFRYSMAGAFSDGVAIVAEGEFNFDTNTYDRYKIINNKDKCVNNKDYRYLAEAGDGNIIFNEGFGEGIMNRRGEVIIKGSYDNIQPFSTNGYSIVTLNGRKGVIDQNGKFILPTLFDDIEGLKYVNSDDYYAFIIKSTAIDENKTSENNDESGGVKTTGSNKNTTEYAISNLSGRVTSSGWLEVKQAYYKGDPLTVKKAVNGEDLYGFITASGNLLVEPKFSEVGTFMHGLCSVKLYDEETEERLWCFVDKDGETKIKLEDNNLEINSVADIGCFSGNGSVAPVKVKTKSGFKFAYIDRKGDFKTEAIYDVAYSMGEETGLENYALATYTDGDKVIKHLVNKKGEVKDYTDYTVIENVADRVAVAYPKNGGTIYAVIDKNGEVIVELEVGLELSRNCFFGDGYFVFKKKDGDRSLFGIMGKKGKIIVEAKYTAIANAV